MSTTHPSEDATSLPATDLVQHTQGNLKPLEDDAIDCLGCSESDVTDYNEDQDDADEDAGEEEDFVEDYLLVDPADRVAAAVVAKFCDNQDSSTPLKPTTHRIQEPTNARDVAATILEELGPSSSIPQTDIFRWVKTSYAHLATDESIEDYLATSGDYCNGRWVILPKAPKKEEKLYEPYCELINNILEHFRPAGAVGHRKAFDTHLLQFKHDGILPPTSHYTSPDIAIEASGPSFTLSSYEIIGFSNIASFYDGKLDKNGGKLAEQLPQMSIYARQMFIQQPNRRFVRCLIVTEKRIRLFHFDRSGVQYSQLVNIHQHKKFFIRLVLGLCSFDEELLGLDTSFQWITGPKGVKIGGTLETIGPDNDIVKYDLDMRQEIFHRTSIRGRGTVCWPVKDRETGVRYLVKDYWMSDGRTPEYELLEKVRHTPGICHMISHEEGRPETKDFRGDRSAFKKGTFHNRKSIRVTIKSYGSSIDNFSSPEELLAALRDAIAAHKTLVSAGILHRDITYNNILIGIKGFESEDGERGIIIDLDMGLESRPIADICEDFRTGTIMFQSLMVSKYFADLDKGMIPAHDYLDDLESFFWLLVFLLFIYKPNGEKMPKHVFHDNLWAFENEAESHRMKVYFIESPSILHNASLAIHPDWPTSCFKLFTEFYTFVGTIRQAKEKTLYKLKEPREDGAIPNRFSEILADVNGSYSTIIEYFDAALQDLRVSSMKAHEDLQDGPSTSEVSALPASPQRPRTRSLRNNAPLVELSLDPRTPKRRNSNIEPELIEAPARLKRRCLPGPSDLSQAETFDSDQDSDV